MTDSTALLPDATARQDALNIERSCIVQAPAGSGKTELLTLRYLKLLSVSSEPEQVLAITFTRKAASEMRDRILSTLNWAQSLKGTSFKPEKEFEQQRLTIANSVLERNEELNWNILENPIRLRVQTIDSFCFYLANQLPVLSRIGGSPTLSEDIDHVYAHAIENTLKKLDTPDPISEDIERLLIHFDNNISRVERLLSGLLNKRDQWTSHVLFIQHNYSKVQDYLVSNLIELVEESLEQLQYSASEYQVSLLPLVKFAAGNLVNQSSIWEEIEALTELPEASIDSLGMWKQLALLFLTKTGTWRAAVNKNTGFPAGDKADKEFTALCKQRKSEFSELIETLKLDDKFLELLNYVRILPEPASETQQWEFLSSITNVLIQLNAQLLLSFSQFGMMDYTQAGSAARQSLGSEDEPTDLALTLDHKIQHILVDEFQDTSQLQLEILQMLTLGWQSGDGRSLFLVGDAMQSCYGFRNANVGIYLNVQEHGIGEIALDSLILRSNFRSQENVVSWVNKIFVDAFPSQADSSRGAVSYSASAPIHEAVDKYDVNSTLISHDGTNRLGAQVAEAQLVVDHIKTIKAANPDDSIAILVRNRSHLKEIIPALKDSAIDWQATDIDRLGALPIIEDLLSLTRALSNQADSLAWYSVLRAPWCGLSRADLFLVAQAATDQPVWQAIDSIVKSANSDSPSLSTLGMNYLTPVVEVLRYGILAHRRASLRQVVEACWILLRGQDTANNEEQLDSAAHYFELLSSYESGQSMADMHLFEEQVKSSFVSNKTQNNGANPINILTMHKSKGLEFDHVLLPGLSRFTASDDKPLMQWYERLNAAGENKLFLATQTATGKDEDALFQLIRHEQKQKSLYEDTRLLYIAVTRAKLSAHLFGVVIDNEKKKPVPPKNSLLARIWPQLEAHGAIGAVEQVAPLTENASTNLSPSLSIDQHQEMLRRFSNPVNPTIEEMDVIMGFAEEFEIDADEEPLTPEFDDGKAALIGTLIHRALEVFIRSGCPKDWLDNIEQQADYWKLQLRELIDEEKELAQVSDHIQQTLAQTLSNPNLQWVFLSGNEDNQVELSITNHKQKISVIDRTFVDKNNVRWIIDFKTGQPAKGQSTDNFIEVMKHRYQNQLERYRDLFKELEHRPTKLALLLTAIDQLVEL